MALFAAGGVAASSAAAATGGASASKFWRPGTLAPGSSVVREDVHDLGGGLVAHAAIASGSGSAATPQSLRQHRMVLPIAGHRSQLLYALAQHQVLIMVGETGSGKSSQLPQYLDEAGWTSGGGMIGVTQPRRVAASSVASRIAQEMGVRLGDEVGYAVRFEECTSSATRIKLMTDGLLLRETLADPLLGRYSVIMLDEAHERSVSTDVLMGLLKKILRRRTDLRLIVSSATLDAERFLEYFQGSMPDGRPSACILTVEGRQFPVDVFYSGAPVQDYLRASVDTVMHIASTQPAGDILLFLTGREEIDRVCAMLDEEAGGDATRSTLNLKIMPLYAGLPADRQLKIFEPAPYGQRKVIVSTNVAEASVTIDGIGYVLDCGFAKLRHYEPRSGTSHLAIQAISQAAAQQRSGRSGRTKKGVAYRLYTEAAFQAMPSRTPPELQRSNLTSVLLQLKALGIDQLLAFEWMDPPPLPLVAKALELLHSLGALDAKAQLTKTGRILADMPLEPNLGRMLLASAGISEPTTRPSNDDAMSDAAAAPLPPPPVQCSEEVLSVAAMLSVDGVFLTPTQARGRADASRAHFSVHEGDHLTLLNVFNAFVGVRKKDPAAWCHRNRLNFKALARAVDIRKQLRSYLLRADPSLRIVSSGGDSEAIRKAVLAGFFMNVAHLQRDGTYRPVRAPPSQSRNMSTSSASSDSSSGALHIHPSSVLHATLQSAVKPAFVMYTELVETTKLFMRDLSVVEPEWLSQIAPDLYELRSGFEEENRRHERLAAQAEAQARSHSNNAHETDGVVGEPDRKHRKLF